MRHEIKANATVTATAGGNRSIKFNCPEVVVYIRERLKTRGREAATSKNAGFARGGPIADLIDWFGFIPKKDTQADYSNKYYGYWRKLVY